MFSKNIMTIGLVLSGSLINAAQHQGFTRVTSLDQLQGVKRVVVAGSALEHRRDLGKLLVHHDENGFKVQAHEGGISEVQSHNTSKELRGLATDTIAKILASGDSYLKVKQYSDGEYGIDVAGRLQGGGPLLSAFATHASMVAVNVVGHVVLLGVSALSGPAAPAVYSGLAATYGPAILLASKGVAIGMGILTAPLPTP